MQRRKLKQSVPNKICLWWKRHELIQILNCYVASFEFWYALILLSSIEMVYWKLWSLPAENNFRMTPSNSKLQSLNKPVYLSVRCNTDRKYSTKTTSCYCSMNAGQSSQYCFIILEKYKSDEYISVTATETGWGSKLLYHSKHNARFCIKLTEWTALMSMHHTSFFYSWLTARSHKAEKGTFSETYLLPTISFRFPWYMEKILLKGRNQNYLY